MYVCMYVYICHIFNRCIHTLKQNKVARDLSELNQMEAMAETVNFIDGPEVKEAYYASKRDLCK